MTIDQFLAQDATEAATEARKQGFSGDPSRAEAWSADIELCEEKLGRELTATEATRWLAELRRRLVG